MKAFSNTIESQPVSTVETLVSTEHAEIVNKEAIVRAARAILEHEDFIRKMLHTITTNERLRVQLGDGYFQEFPEKVHDLEVAHLGLEDLVVLPVDAFIESDAQTGPTSMSVEDIAGQIAGSNRFDSQELRLMPIDKRIAYVGRELEMLEKLESCERIGCLNQCLQEMLFRVRDTLVGDVYLDDAALLSHEKGGRSVMLLYLAAENAYAGDFVTAEEILTEMEVEVPHIARFLRERLREAEAFDMQQRRISKSVSEQHLTDFAGADVGKWREKALGTHFDITIGMKPDVAISVFSGAITGRLLAAPEFSTSGGKTIEKKPIRNTGYNDKRQRMDAEQLGYFSAENLFMPQLVYGALSAENRPDKGNGYGEVVLYVKDKDGISFSIGDSMPKVGDHRHIQETRVNREDAEVAAVLNEAHGERRRGVNGNWYSTNVAYIEAQIPGVTFDDINYVGLTHFSKDQSDEKGVEKMTDVAKAIMEHGIRVSLDFYYDSRLTYGYINVGDHSTSIADQIRKHIDPTGEKWPLIDVRIIDPIPRAGESPEACAKRYSVIEGMTVIMNGSIWQPNHEKEKAA